MRYDGTFMEQRQCGTGALINMGIGHERGEKLVGSMPNIITIFFDK